MLAGILLFSCRNTTANNEDEGLNNFSAESLKNHIAILASDSFEGRKPFTAGETKTIQYLGNQFKNLGLEPGNGDSYLQEVPMVNIATMASKQMRVQSTSGNFTLSGFDDYVIWTNKVDPLISLNNNQVVFAGYGVVAPEYNWNDYAGIDVKDKVVMVLVNDPGFNSGDTSLFKGKEMTYYGRWTYKFEEAARQGAKGCLIIHNTAAASYPFTVVQNNWNGSRLRLDPRGKQEKNSDLIGWVTSAAAQKLLQAAGADSNLLAQADKRGFKPVMLDLKISTTIQVKAEYNKSYNVVAKITGTTRPKEYIVYSAHWDHLGIGKPDETGDSIYNGALDNASGTAGILEIARVFKSLKTPPKRTIVFLAVTAEEQGLWGSAYYAQNPIYPAKATIANINIDGLNGNGKTKDIIIVGKGQNTLEDDLRTLASKQGRELLYENHPEAGIYYRSDHFNFAKAGIPALFTEHGINLIGKDTAEGERLNTEYLQKHYHRPSDEYQPTWTMEGGIEDLKLFFLLGKQLANSDTTPTWKAGSEFRKIRETL